MATAVIRKAWRLLPMEARANVGRSVRSALAPHMARRLPRALPEDRQPADRVAILGLTGSRLGVGEGARLLLRELEMAGIAVTPSDVTGVLGAPSDDLGRSEAPQPGRSPLIVALNPDVAVPYLATRPRSLLRHRRIIGFWVWELDVLPPAWGIGRRWVHEIWTPSAFSAKALSALGAPIHVTPHPIMVAPHRPLPTRAQARAALGVDEATFLAVTSFSLSSSLTRKNPQAAIIAMARAFQDADALLLVRALEAERYPKAWRALQAAAGPFKKHVRVLDESGALDRLDQLYAAGDVYLSLHRSEGFGLNIAEAMRYGLPVVTTAYAAPMEYLDTSCAALVSYRPVAAHDPFGPYTTPGGTWADPDIEDAAAQLADLAAHPARRTAIARAAVARAARMTGGAAARALRLEH